MLNGVFTELNEAGEIKENGISHKSTISIEFVEDAKLKKKLMQSCLVINRSL